MDVKTTFRNLVRDQSVSICMLQSSSRPLGRSGLSMFAVRQGHTLLGVLGYHHRWSLRLLGLLGLDQWQEQGPETVDAFQQAGIVSFNSQRFIVVCHL